MNRMFSFIDTKGILYVVSTPIGNLKEFSSRQEEVLSSSDYIASEDTRTTGLLLSKFGISKPMISCHEHNENEASERIISLLKEGKTISLTSDAGYPGISDPGQKVVAKVIEYGFPVSIVNGSNAFIPALIGSGLNTDHFYFHGFLPSKHGERINELNKIKNYPMTIIFYESPHRIIESLKDILEVFGNRNASIAREITKLHEEYIRGQLNELVTLNKDTLLGEMVIVVEGKKEEEITITEEELIKIIKSRLKQNDISKKDLANELADIYNLKKKEVYNLINKIY